MTKLHAYRSPTRRGLVTRAGLLASLIATGTYTPAASASAADLSDAALLQLVAMLEQAAERKRAYGLATSEAMSSRYVSPQVPKDLRFVWTDFPRICAEPFERCSQQDFRGKLRPVYTDGPDALSPAAQAFWQRGDTSHLTKAERVRIREIRAAHRRWQADVDHAEEIAGVAVPGRAFDRESALVDDLLRKIAATPAQTLDGLAAKAHACAIAEGATPAGLERRFLALLAKPDLAPDRVQELASLSLLVDATRLQAATAGPAKSKTAA